MNKSKANNTTEYDWAGVYQSRLNNYFRFDTRIRHQLNKAQTTQVWSLNIQNTSIRKNIHDYYFNDETNVKDQWNQTGLLPVLSYKIMFYILDNTY